ncbi:PQQ-binding-like beta-propeller repeat protein [Natrarchaeobius sp. A-rgal3]|uniref:outer membrane protein assembly factor BamB family protein n=1 Tax=Natrarchaeobius versutus TaxID=1679078 RepID=UPI00350F0424
MSFGNGFSRRHLLQGGALAIIGKMGVAQATTTNQDFEPALVDSDNDAPAGSTPAKRRVQFDVHNSGVNPNGTAPRSEVEQLWTTSVAGSIKSSPAVVADTLYVSSDMGVFALSTTDGTEQWRVEWDRSSDQSDWSSTKHSRSSPTVVDSTVYVGNSSGTMFSVNADDGTVRWTRDLDGSIFASPQVEDGSLYIGTTGRMCYSLDVSDGSTEWMKSAGRQAPVVGSSVLIDDTVVFAGGLSPVTRRDGPHDSGPGTLRAFDVESGSLQWEFPEPVNDPYMPWQLGREIGGIPVSLTADENAIYFYTREQHERIRDHPDMFFHAVDAQRGFELWQQPHVNRPYGSFAVDQDRLYGWNYVDDYVAFCALDKGSGAVLWSQRFSGAVTHPRSPVVVGDVVYVCAPARVDETVYALDTRTGQVLWTYDTGTFAVGPPAPVGGSVYVGDHNGTVTALGTKGELELSVKTTESNPMRGEKTKLEFSIRNTSSVPVTPRLNLNSTPENLSIEGHFDDGGTFDAADTPSWNWAELETNEQVTPSLTLVVDEEADAAEHTITAEVTDDDDETFPTFDIETTLTITETEFDQKKHDKQDLADRITAAAKTLDESSTVENALGELSAAVDSEEVDEQVASEAVDRMILGEEITDTAIKTVGPGQSQDPETRETNLARAIAQNTVDAAATAATMAAQIARLVRFIPNRFKRHLTFGVDDLLDEATTFIQRKARLSDNIATLLGADGPIGSAFEDIRTATNPVDSSADLVLGQFEKEQELERELRAAFEGGRSNDNISKVVTTMTERLSGQLGPSPEPYFNDSFKTAEAASTDAINEIIEIATEADKELERAEIRGVVTEVLSTIMWAFRQHFARPSGTGAATIGQISRRRGVGRMMFTMQITLDLWAKFMEPLATVTDGAVALAEIGRAHNHGIGSVGGWGDLQ